MYFPKIKIVFDASYLSEIRDGKWEHLLTNSNFGENNYIRLIHVNGRNKYVCSIYPKFCFLVCSFYIIFK